MKTKHLKDIYIFTIPHKEQDYETVGNYIDNPAMEATDIFVSQMSDWRYEFLVAVHELIEYGIVKYQKIPLKSIDTFDIAFEKKRKKGNTDEPGDDPKCPYRKAHQFATMCEKLLAQMLGVKWKIYEKEINSL